MSKKLLIIYIIFILKITVLADIQIIQEVKIKKHDLKSGIKSINKSMQIKWVTSDKIINIHEHLTSILDLSKKKKSGNFIIIDRKNKEYFKTSFPLFFSKLLPKELTAIKLNQLPKLRMRELDVEEQIGKYKCKLYKITLNFMMMMIKIKVWASEDPFQDSSLSDKSGLRVFNSSSFIKYFYPGLSEAKIKKNRSFKKLNKIKGMHIKSIIEMDLLIKKIVITTVLKKIVENDAPENIISIPADFKERVNFQK